MKTIKDLNFLRDLLAPMSVEQFFDEYWDKKAFYISRNDEQYFKSTLTKEQIKTWLKYANLTFPTVELVHKGRTASDDFSTDHRQNNYNDGKRVDKKKLGQLFDKGHSILVNYFSQFIPSLAEKMENLSHLFEGVVKDYLIISTAQKKAFSTHYDKEHVFAFQISGEKEWLIHDRYSSYMRSEHITFPFTPSPDHSFKMKPGDFLYIPPGLRHQTKTLSTTPSMSISIAVNLLNGIDFLKKIVEYSYVKHPNLRQRIPNPYATLTEKQAYLEGIKSTFLSYFETVDMEQIYEILQIKNQQPIENILEKENSTPEITLETTLTKINTRAPIMQSDQKIIRFQYLDKVLTFHQVYSFSLNFIEKQTSTFKVKDIFGMLGNDLKIDLSKQLIEINYLKIADH